MEIRERFGKTRILKIPYELSVEEVERLLEINVQIDKLAEQKIDDEDFNAQTESLKTFWSFLFAQCTIIFRHYQPEVTEEYLRKHLSDTVALEITGFFENNRTYKTQKTRFTAEAKKKSNLSAEEQLKSIRRTVVFMVRNGFSLYDLKKLYIDEFFNYYYELVYSLEQSKELPEGSYDKAQGIDRSGQKMDDFFGSLKIT